ncbi:tail morphogenetic protein [Staphylococcus phage Twort]|uniref:Tail morphogenetic protein n=2 Tax=Staphylococcus phage Twort (strain DSM 17442 / HER 48) TaxID=2908167 RepID=A0A6H0X5D2_BPTWO|nr:tail protein with lysin activity [Staphylococcus phage Twort]AAX92303.1 ORF007 [Staphylococcus phage Twort]QIW89113.1 tail morphogenetic protein [Staphylococcus phage Twort]
MAHKMHRFRRPKVRFEFHTDENIFTLRYENTKEVSGGQLGDKIINFETKNAMADDSAVFVLTLAGDTHWDKLLMINDIVKIFVNPSMEDDTEGQVLIGMISSVNNVGSYGNNQKAYRITGQSFSKPFMKFGLGVMREVNAFLPMAGWLEDGEGEGKIKFTGSSSHEVMKQILDRFVPYMRYKYPNKQGKPISNLTEYFMWDNLESWDEYENIRDVTPFINFDGSLSDLMDFTTAKPFNEKFYRNNKEQGKTELVLRRTPFNPTQWRALEYTVVETEDLIEEDVGKNDVETYSIFNVTNSMMYKQIDAKVFSKPQYHKELVDRYGYSRLEVENPFIFDEDKSTTDEESNDNDTGQELGSYDKVVNDLNNMGRDNISRNTEKMVSKLARTYRNIRKDKAKKIVDYYVGNGKLPKSEYEKIVGRTIESEQEQDKRPEATKESVSKILNDVFKNNEDYKNKEKKNEAIGKLSKDFKYGNKAKSKKLVDKLEKTQGATKDKDIESFIKDLANLSNVSADTGSNPSDSPLLIFSKMLFNWYHNNPNFFSGEITVLGHPKYDLGQRLFVKDNQRNEMWEFYVESVQHKFSYKEGYITILGVTRGLKSATIPEGSKYRFAEPWGTSSNFEGGLLGEKKSEELKAQGVEERKSSGGDSDSSGAHHSGASLASLDKKYKGKELPTPRNKTDTSWTAPGNPNTGQWARECTWYCYNRRYELGLKAVAYGDAADWIAGARGAGISTGKEPKRGAVAVWARGVPGGSAQYGHVAFVEKVTDDGIYVSDYNYASPKTYGERLYKKGSPEYRNAQYIYD